VVVAEPEKPFVFAVDILPFIANVTNVFPTDINLVPAVRVVFSSTVSNVAPAVKLPLIARFEFNTKFVPAFETL
jgi:hypothetical protein